MHVSRSLVVISAGVVVALSGVKPGIAQPQSSPTDKKNAPSSEVAPVTPLPPSAPDKQPSPKSSPDIPQPTNSDNSEAQPTPEPTSAPSAEPTNVQPAAKPSSAVFPEYLNPNPNPLQFPTKPEEVRIRGTQPITLQQAIELARRNNRTLQVAELQLQRSRAGLREAQAQEYPTIELQTGVTRAQSASGEIQQRRQGNNSLASLFGQNSNQDQVSSSLSGTVQASYDVYTSGARSSRIRAAERQVRSDQLQVEVTLEQLILDVSNDYYDLQESDENVRINTAAVRNAETSLKDAQALERAGLGTRFDVLQAQVQLANAQQDLTNSISQQQVRQRQLAQRLSLAQTVNVVVADAVQEAGKWNLPIEETIVLAFKNRAELEQQLVQREIANQQRRLALSALGPRVSLVAQYNLLDIFDDGVGIADGYSFAANINWQLFEGGAARAQARQSEADMAIAETRFADQRNVVRFEVEQAYSSLQSNLQNITTATTAVDQAREALRLARLRFQAGVGTQSQVIDAETALTRAEGNRIQAILGYNRALAALQRAVTNLPLNVISTVPPTNP
ncbi:MAG: TolC family protein [Scytolyngbya sp. HA4215-MV1]|jgi:OMF family outer membrane factor|nr:TolC family protein [Scytolyngbya sp. HA4215-MV1]